MLCPRCGNVLITDGEALMSWAVCEVCQYSNNILSILLKKDKIAIEAAAEKMVAGEPGPHGARLEDLWYLSSAARIKNRAGKLGTYARTAWDDFVRSCCGGKQDTVRNPPIMSISKGMIESLPAYYTRCSPIPWGTREPSGLNLPLYRRQRECVGWCTLLQYPGENFRDMRWYVHVADDQLDDPKGFLSYRMAYVSPETELILTDDPKLYLQLVYWTDSEQLTGSETILPVLLLWDREEAVKTLFQYRWCVSRITILSDQRQVIQDVCEQMRVHTPLRCVKFRTLTDALTGRASTSYASAGALEEALRSRSLELEIKPQHPSPRLRHTSTGPDERPADCAAGKRS